MNKEEIINTIALSSIGYFNAVGLHDLYQRVGSATAVFELGENIRDVLPEASERLQKALTDTAEVKHRAEAELQWCEDNKVQAIAIGDERYPQRLKDCPDAPLVLYYMGNANLNTQKVVSVVGTRHITPYGQDIIRRFMQDLRLMCPDTLVVSGLAYGVDINAHRESLRNGMPTVGVLAHGLDQIYPRQHRSTAIEMLKNGGLLTEYPNGTQGAKMNFVQRNRIVAGMADATILVESAEKAGGLITMGIARDYNRDTFAFPGPVTAEYSKGCNNLIRDNGATLITCAEDFVNLMGWQDARQMDKARAGGIERQMFPDLTEDEQAVVKLLQEINDLQINILAAKSGIAINKLTTILFSLEMKGVIRTMAGGCYHLITPIPNPSPE